MIIHSEWGCRKTFNQQITNHLDIYKPFPERFTKIAQWVAAKPGYKFKHLTVKGFDQFAEDFIEIYNDAWRDFESFVPIRKETVMESFTKMKPIMDEKLVWFAYINDQPAAFVVILPDANEFICDKAKEKGVGGCKIQTTRLI